ncbi:hypothetical protein GDO81_023997 [Engystomops pustulosus]|uniref:Uncharacterized protein n=1 Tax=Engystomops pustulosus TaxID=76066 RepID=A0AAV6ZB27_ENGPU|nr:hypothetical protein GDO81_023997 [Engystomops pustulosus]
MEKVTDETIHENCCIKETTIGEEFSKKNHKDLFRSINTLNHQAPETKKTPESPTADHRDKRQMSYISMGGVMCPTQDSDVPGLTH